jgi:23S rRNA (adenine2503-C2)-methyltransferase
MINRNIIKRINVPTGDILIIEGNSGKLECLSLADYGKDVNIKCDALGLSRDPNPVRHTSLLPLTEKWVITISTQYGCSMNCNFCDVPKVGPGRNCSVEDLLNQIEAAMQLHPEISSGKRLNLHYARMGEPTWNPNVLVATQLLAKSLIKTNNKGFDEFHPVVSTMMPSRNNKLKQFINDWCFIKNSTLSGEAGLQLSINSTSEEERNEMFSKNALSLAEISNVMHGLVPVGRKFTLNFAIANWEINPEVLLKYFSPKDYLLKLTPMHKTANAEFNQIRTHGNATEYYPYKEYEEKLRRAGYDVLVFIASKEEDESRITCGNAILADKLSE